MKKILLLFILSILFLSCSTSKQMQKSLKKNKSPLDYLFDTKISDLSKSDSIYINFDTFKIDSITKVSRKSVLILPFIVFNYFEKNLNVKLGQNSIEQNYNDFFNTSFIKESRRSGNFLVAKNNIINSNYSLDIFINNCKTKSRYQISTTVVYLLLAASTYREEIGFPAETNMQLSATLKKGNSIILEKNYSINHIQPFINTNVEKTKQLHFNFNANMVESLSLSTKKCIEEIIKDINLELQNK